MAKFLEADTVLVAENGLHIKKGVALVGMAVGTRVALAVGRLVGRAEGLVVGAVVGGDMTLPMICTVPIHAALPKQPCLTVNVWHCWYCATYLAEAVQVIEEHLLFAPQPSSF